MKNHLLKITFSNRLFYSVFTLVLILALSSSVASQNNEFANNSQLSLADDKIIENKGFIPERGQFLTFPELQYFYSGDNAFLYFLNDKIVFITKEIKYVENDQSKEALARGDENLAKKLSAVIEAHRFDLEFANCNFNVEVEGEGANLVKHDYYLAHCPDGILDVPSYQKIKYNNLYDNIDMIFSFDENALKYEFVVKNGADPSIINLNWQGVKDLSKNDKDEIQFKSGSFTFIDKAPVSFCGENRVNTNYEINGNSVKFSVDDYNTTETLIIDPGLFWASSLEYNGYGTWGDLVTNSLGQYYIVDWEWNPGSADMLNYFNSAGTSTLYSSDATNDDIVISKFSKTGYLLWVCRYGGTGNDDVNGGVALDNNGNLFIAGTSQKEFSAGSGNFPLQSWAGAFYQGWDGSLSTGTRGYLLKFLPNNTRQWATYLDRGANLEVFDIACGLNNNIYMCGKSGGSPTYITASSIPSGSGYLGALNGTTTAHSFIMQFNSSGALYWATWLPGVTASTMTGRSSDIAVDSNGNICVAGDEMWSSSTRFSTALITAGYTNLGQNDLFYMRFNSSNQPVPSYGKYIGGAGFDKINIGAANGDIEIDASGNMYMCGHTYSANFPVLDPGGCAYYDGVINDGTGITANVATNQDGYLFKVNTSGTITYSTFFGGTAYTSMKKLQKDSHDNLWICAHQNSTGLATVNHNDYFNQAFAGTNSNIMFAQLNEDDRMDWLSYYGFASGYSGYDGFDILEPTVDSVYLYLAGKFNVISNVGGGYQYTAATTCTGSAVFHNYLSATAPFSISGTSTLCAGATTTWTSTMPGGTWSSSNTGIFTVNPSTGLVTGVSGGTATITYTLSISGCSYFTNATITINPGPTLASSVSASPTSICSGNSSTLSYSGGSGTTFNWYTGACGGTLVGTGNNLIVSPSSTTTYYGAWQNSCGLSSCRTITVTVTPNASITSVTGSSPICDGATTTFSANSVVLGGGTGSWSSSNTSVATVNSSGVVTGQNPGTCNIIYTITGGCGGTVSAQQSITVTANASIASVTGSSPICDGATTTFSANSVVLGGGTGSWSSSNTSVATVNSSGVVTGQNPGTCNIIYTITGGCGGTVSAQQSITVTANASIASVTGTSPICDGATTTFSANSVVLGGGTGSWSSSNTSVATVNSSGVVTGQNPGTCNIIYTITGGCGGTVSAQQSITVTANASIASVTGTSPICDGATTTFSANSVVLGGGTGSWSSNNTSIATVNSSGVVTGVGAGTCNIIYTITGGCGGTVSSQQAITVNANSTAPSNLNASLSSVCSGTNVTLTVNGGSLGTGANWELYSGSCGGTLISSNGTGVFIVAPTSTTTYYVLASGTCNTTSCVSTTITVNPLPDPAGTITGPVAVCQGQNGITYSIPVIANVSSYVWTFPSGFTGSSSTNSISLNVGVTAVSGDIIVYGTNACGNGVSATLNVTVSTASTDPTSATATNTTICEGTSTDVMVNGGSLGIGADWFWYEGACGGGSSIGNGSSITVSPTSTTVYYVRAEGACNNSACVSVVVNVVAAPNAGTNGVVSLCEGDPSINMFTELGGSPTGGGVWTNSVGTVVTNIFDPSTMSSEIFTYTVSGTSPCNDATATVDITVDPLPVVSFTDLDSVYCGDGSTIILTGNQAPGGTFSGVDVIDNADGTADYTYVTPGTHNITYTFTNGFGCTNSAIQTVVIQALPSVAFVGLDTAYCLGEPIDNIIGNHAPSGIFMGSGITDNGDGSATFNPNIVGIQTITYQYTDANGCSDTDDQTIEVYENPLISNVNIVDVTVCTAPYNGEISVDGNGGSGNYLFAINGGALGVSNIFTGLNAGNYVITVEDNYGCSSDSSISVNSNTGFNIDSVEVTDIICYGDSLGQIVVHANGGVLYSIDNGVTFFADSTFVNLLAGSYGIVAQDTGSCTDVANVTINQSNEIIVNTNVVDVSCGGNNGSASITVSGGLSPYTYLWSNNDTTSIINNLSEGIYDLTVTDNYGCEVTTSITIGNGGGTLATSIINLVGVSCNGNNDGSATVTVSGAGSYTYLWSNNDTTSTITGLSGGYYYVTVEDQFGCFGIDTAFISEPLQLTYNEIITDVSCYGGTDGMIDLNISGGTPVYTFTWLPSGFTQSGDTYSNLPPNTYAVTVTDANGCSITIPKLDVGEPDQINISFSGNMPSCYGYSDGVCYVSATGGLSPYSYVWSEGTIGSTITNISSGQYYVTLTDANSCVVIDTLKLPTLAQILYTEEITDASCIGNNDGEIILGVYNGNGPFTFAWNTEPVQTDSLAVGLIAGIYEVTITDIDGCEIMREFEVMDGTTSCLVIPTVFTPNNDGINDKWVLEGIWIQNDIHIEIFNRWGDVIYTHDGSGSDYDSNQWDGTYNGKELPISSYVYIIDLKDGSEPIQGIVTIKK